MRIAVLALQGAFIEHERMLERLGVETFEVRQLSDWLQPKEGLIIPGGESTTQLRLLNDLGLLLPIRQAILDGLPVFGTCAGLILLAKQEDGLPREGLCTMDIDVCRNAYGRQLGSFNARGKVNGVAEDFPMTYIRAPYIHRTLSPEVEILSEADGHIVAVRQGHQLATAFHPELTEDDRLHQYFCDFVAMFKQRATACMFPTESLGSTNLSEQG
ncbi:MAG: pyridoxal 5'-phosphate synthase glutaminase subunit PdxT [Bacteroidaceae bacterium]|nr:pyridoxal 5'-phosphate synthase glutaminase subunit PdxT [Bacteroidaceae bacterium]